MSLTIKQLPVESRPRERLVHTGPGSLSDPELIALLFGGDLAAADEVLAQLGSLAALRHATVGRLCEVPGVGPARAAQLVGALELGRRAGQSLSHDVAVRGPDQARALLSDLATLEQEELRVLALDARHRPLSRFTAAVGTANVVHVSPRDIFRRALRDGAVAVIVAHNHPSGDPTPSADDLRLTHRLGAAGDLVGVALLDHLIIADDGCYSFKETRLLR